MELTEKQKKNFWKKVNKTDTCWLWTGYCRSDGYARVGINKQFQYIHRITWFLTGNIIPEGHIIRHKCRNRNCCNPEHLETGTYTENQSDRIRDGTTVKGEKQHLAKLTSAQVIDIRLSTESQRKLAKRYNVSQSAIYHIINRKTWMHIE